MNTDRFKNNCGYNDAFLKEMGKMYIETLIPEMVRLRGLIDIDRVSELKAGLHRAKPSFELYGMSETGEIIGKIESHLIMGKFELEYLRENFDLIMEDLKAGEKQIREII